MNNNVSNEFMNNSSIVFQDNNNTILLTNIKYILDNFQIENWSKNRPEDTIRVEEIAKYYESNNIKIIPGTIHVWLHNEIHYIYDGLHRFLAAKLLNENSLRPINLNILLSINYSKFEDNIINDFININKSIPIPFIYVDDTEKLKSISVKI